MATLKFSGGGGASAGSVSAVWKGTTAAAGPVPGTDPGLRAGRAEPGLGAGRASTSDTESSVMGTNSEGVAAVVRSSDIMGDWSELSAPRRSPGHEPGVRPPLPPAPPPSGGGSRITSGGRW